MVSLIRKEKGKSILDQLETGDLLMQPFYCSEHKCRAITLPHPGVQGSYYHVCSGADDNISDLIKKYESSMPPSAHFIAESPNMVDMIIAQQNHLYMKYFLNYREKGSNGQPPNTKTYLPFLNFASIPMDAQSWSDIIGALKRVMGEDESVR